MAAVISLLSGLVNMLCVLLMVLMCVAFFTLFERKIMAVMQSRMGPFKVGIAGLLQPMVDALKLLTKLKIGVSNETKRTSLIDVSPAVFMVLSLVSWMAYPVVWTYLDCQSMMVMVLVAMSLSVYGLVTIGWVSKSKYAIIGALRAVSQSISYEMVFMLSMLGIMWLLSTASFGDVWILAYLCPLVVALSVAFVTSFVSLLAESSRPPFDLSEGEAEIVAGWNIELGSQSFTLAFLSEQLSVVWMCVLLTTVFLGVTALAMKVVSLLLAVVATRVAFPRMRFDKVMNTCWTQLLPLLILFYLMLIIFT
nr:NADH dehydrogenase subunit 1 [Degeeriella rufa]